MMFSSFSTYGNNIKLFHWNYYSYSLCVSPNQGSHLK